MRFLSIVALATLLTGAAPERTSRLIQEAESFEASLKANGAHLKYRHYIEHLIALWSDARAHAQGPERLVAIEGEARARKLLAHWSGRSDDRAKAEEIAREAEREKSPPSSPMKKPSKPKQAVARLGEVRLENHEGAVRLWLAVEGSFKTSTERIPAAGDRPARMAFDLRPMKAATAAMKSIPVNAGGIARVRTAQFDEQTVRLVIEAEAGKALPAKLALAQEDKGAFIALAEDEARESAKADEEAKSSSDTLLQIVKEMRIEEPAAEETEPTEEAGETDPQLLKRSTREALRPREASLLRIQRIVVDAGHGGRDFGAQGVKGVREKDVNLQIALKLGQELKRRLGVKVIYTRSGDEFVSLRKRALIANRNNADLFVSIHANAHRRASISGIETYYLNTTSDRYAARLAVRENTGTVAEADEDPEPRGASPEVGSGPGREPSAALAEADEGDLPGGDMGRDLRLILADLAMRSASLESKRLAGYVQASLVGSLRKKHTDVHDLGVKHALFYVLLGARMPSVLVETGFVTHPDEGKRLAEPRYQTEAASAIAQGIVRFAKEREIIVKRLGDNEEVRLASVEHR